MAAPPASRPPAITEFMQQPRKRVERGYVELRNTIEGDVAVSGGQLVLYGEVRGNLRVTGGRATIHGLVTGDVINDGGHVVVLGEVGGAVSGPREYTIVEKPKRTRRAVPERTQKPLGWISKLGYGFAAASLMLLLGVSLTLRSGDQPPATKVAAAIELRDVPSATVLMNDVDDPAAPLAPANAKIVAAPEISADDRVQPGSKADSTDCHPNYGPCVPLATDVDCAFRGGDGPAYAGQVAVLDVDVFELDADGDGITCNE